MILKDLYQYYLIKRSGLFDANYYLLQNPDVRQADIDPLWHFIRFGWKEGRGPNPNFSCNYYNETHHDVKRSQMNPLAHYVKFGESENRSTNVRLPSKNIQPAGLVSKNQATLWNDELWRNIQELPLSQTVDIVICVGPNPSNVIECLSSIRKYTNESSYNLHFVIHQNDLEKISSIISPDINLHLHDMELFNYSRANNMVMRHSVNDIVLLNDDTEVTPGWLEKLQKASKGVALTGAHTHHGCAGNPDMYGDGPTILTHFPINMFCAYIPRRLKEVVGLLDEEFVYYGGEDVDYSIRALMNGFPLVISEAFVIHKDNQSFKESKEMLIKESDKIILDKYGIVSPFNLSSVIPLVSIILATHNRPQLLHAAIESIEKINYENFELIIVDDGSSNQTSKVVLKAQDQNSNIKYIRLAKNQGAAEARMVGLRASNGQFVFFADDDDTVLMNRISGPMECLLTRPNLDVVYCNYNVVNDQGIFPIYTENFDRQRYLEMEFYIGLGILLGRKKPFSEVPLKTSYNNAGDYDWVFRLLRKGYKIDLCPEIVMNYNRTGPMDQHLTGTEASHKQHQEIYEREILLKKIERYD